MTNFDEFVVFVRSAAKSLDIPENIVFEIMTDSDEDATYVRYGNEYTRVRDAYDIWKDAIAFARGEK
jgi:hypothetical protein